MSKGQVYPGKNILSLSPQTPTVASVEQQVWQLLEQLPPHKQEQVIARVRARLRSQGGGGVA